MKFKVKGQTAIEVRGEGGNTRYITFRVIKTYGEDMTTILEEVWRGS